MLRLGRNAELGDMTTTHNLQGPRLHRLFSDYLQNQKGTQLLGQL